MTTEAPPTDHEEREEAARTAKKILVITVRGERETLAYFSIPTKTRLLVRKVLGAPLDDFLASAGADSVVVFWWLARFLNGEQGLTFDRAADEWDALEIDQENPDDCTVEWVSADELKGADPES